MDNMNPYKPLTERDVRALTTCVEKYDNYSHPDTSVGQMEFGPDSCALCAIYWGDRACVGCPVAERTGEPGCVGTPFDPSDCDDLHDLRIEWDFTHHTTDQLEATIRERCREEYLFLKDILDNSPRCKT